MVITNDLKPMLARPLGTRGKTQALVNESKFTAASGPPRIFWCKLTPIEPPGA